MPQTSADQAPFSGQRPEAGSQKEPTKTTTTSVTAQNAARHTHAATRTWWVEVDERRVSVRRAIA